MVKRLGKSAAMAKLAKQKDYKVTQLKWAERPYGKRPTNWIGAWPPDKRDAELSANHKALKQAFVEADDPVERFVRVDTDMARAKATLVSRNANPKLDVSGFKPSYILDWWLVVRQEYHDTLGWQYVDRLSNAAYLHHLARATRDVTDTDESAWDDWHIGRCDEALAELDKVEAMLNQLFERASPAPQKRASVSERTPAQQAALKDIRKCFGKRSKRAP